MSPDRARVVKGSATCDRSRGREFVVVKTGRSTCSVVGVGASDGGVDALGRFLGALPADPPFAVVVVHHLDPSARSQLAEIIDRACVLTAKRARSGDVLGVGTVYVVPEGREPFIEQGRLRLRQRSGTCSGPIDALFTSLAAHNEASGCGVLLSGNGSDGVLGLRQIRGAGGMTFAQEPSTAECPSPSATAIQSGVCDFVGSPEQIAAALMVHARRSVSLALENARLLQAERESTQRAETLNAINEIVRATLTPAELLARLVGEVSHVAGAEKCLVLEVHGEELVVTHVHNVRGDLVGHPRARDFYPGFALAAEARRPILIPDTWADPRTNKDFVVPYELRAMQLLPLVVDGAVAAVVALAYDEPREFGPADAEFSERICTAMSVALQNAHLHEAEVRAREEAKRELETSNLLLDAAAAIANRTDPADVARGLAETLLESTDHTRVVVSLFDEANRELVVAASVGESALDVGGRWPLDEVSVAAQEAVLEQKTSVWDLDAVSGPDRGIALEELRMHLALYVPLVRRDAVVGLLIVDDPGRRSEFSARDIRLIQGMAAQAAVAVEQARLFRAEVEAGALAQTLADISACLTSTHDVNAALDDVLAMASDAVGATGAVLAVRESGGWRTAQVHGATVALLGEYYSDEDSPARRRVFETREPYLVADVMADSEADPGLAERIGYRAYAAFPLMYRDAVTGALSLFFAESRPRISPNETEFARRLVFIISAAQENARLLEAEQRARVIETQRAERMRLLREISTLAASSLDTHAVSERVAQGVHRLLGAGLVQLRLLNEEGTFLESEALVDSSDGFLAGLGPMSVDAPYETASAFRSHKARFSQDGLAAHVTKPSKRNISGSGVRAYALLPLVARGKGIGTFFVGWTEPRAFTPDDIGFFKSLADQFVVGFENARLFEAERASSRRVAALHELTEIATSSLELSDVADRALRYVHDELGVDVVTFWMLDDARARLLPVSGVGFPQEFYDGFAGGVGLDEPFEVAAAVKAGAPVMRSGVGISEVPEPVRTSYAKYGVDLQALLVLPVRGRADVIGAVTLAWSTPRGLGPDEVRFFMSVANELAIAAENATLYAAKELELSRTRALQSVATAVSSSLSLDEICKGALREVRELPDIAAAAIYVLDQDGAALRSAAMFGYPEDMRARVSVLPIDDTSNPGRVVAHSLDLLTHEDPGSPPAATQRLAQMGVGDARWVLLPMRNAGRLEGVIRFTFRGERSFQGQEMALFAGIADTLGASLANARLFASEQSELARTSLLKEIASIGASTLDARELAERALDTMRSRTGAAAGNFFAIDRAAGVLRSVASVGIPKKAIATFREIPLATDTASTRVALTGVLANHMGPDPTGTGARAAKLTGNSENGWIALPVSSRGTVLGVLGLSFKDPRPFEPAELTLYLSVSDQLGVALERAMLVRDLEASQHRVSAILQSISDGFYALDRSWRFTYANAEAARMIGVPETDLIGHTIGEALGNPEVQAFQEREFAPAMNDGTVVEFERFFAQTGIWADVRAYPSAEGVAVYGRDITERRTIDLALQQARERADLMAALLEESSQPFGVGNLDGSLALVNRAFEALTGYTGDELSQTSWTTGLTPPEYSDLEAEKLGDLLKTGQPVRYEKEYVRKDGTRVPIELLVHLATDDAGAPRAYYSFITDLTERKERERLDATFNELRTSISATLDYATIVETAVTRGAEAIGSDAADTFARVEGGWSVAASAGVPRTVDAGSISDTGVVLARLLAAEGVPLLVSDAISDERMKPGFARRHGIKSLLAVPLGLPGSEIGFLAFYHSRKRNAFTPMDLEFVTRLARVVGLAIQNSMLYERERNIAETLQDALLTAPESIDGIETAYVYRAASSSADVGGDFCEVFALDAPLCAIVVGDVSGKGIEAARLTSLLHDGIRAYALETSDPAEILARLNRLVRLLSPTEQYATVFLGVLDTETGRMKYCTAGHPAPAIVNASGATYLPGTRAPLLGAFEGSTFACRETTLAAGDRLVAFTDGVTEARHGKRFLGEDRLLKLLGKMTRTPVRRLPQRLFDHVLAFADGALRDDTVILAVELTPKE